MGVRGRIVRMRERRAGWARHRLYVLFSFPLLFSFTLSLFLFLGDKEQGKGEPYYDRLCWSGTRFKDIM